MGSIKDRNGMDLTEGIITIYILICILMCMYIYCCCYSVTKSCPTHCDLMDYSTPGSSVLYYLLEFAQIHVHWINDSIYLILCQPLLLLPSILPNIKVFSNESALCIRWPKYWSFSLSISLSNKYSRLISFRTDWFDLLAVQGTLKGLLQHHRSKASILQHSAFFMVQLSHSVHDYCKNHNFDCTDLCQQSYVSAF